MAGSFAVLERIVTIDVTYRTYGMVAMNTGRSDGLQDNTVSRAGGAEGPPILLGSGLKGVSRSLIEAALARAHVGQICVPDACRGTPGGKQTPPGRKDPCETLVPHAAYKPEAACDACRMFGNPRMRGRVTFHDAHPTQEVVPIARTHVAIARDTGSQAHQALMTMEAIPGMGLCFTGQVTLVNPEPWMVGAIWEMLPLLASVGVGAKKTSGYGDLRVEKREVTFAFPPDEQPPAQYVDECCKAWREKCNPPGQAQSQA